MRSKVVSNFISYGLDMFYVSLVGMLFYFIVGKMMLPADYGIVMSIIALYLVLSPLTAVGLNEAMIKFIPDMSAKNKNKIKPTLNKAVMVSLIFTAIVSVTIFLFSGIIAENIYSNPAMKMPLQIFSVMLFLGTLSIVLRGILHGFKMFKHMLGIDIVSQTLRIGLPVFLIAVGYGITGALAGWIVCFILISILSIPFIFRILPAGRGTADSRIITYGITSALSASGLWLLVQTGVLILSMFDTHAAGLFGVVTVFGQIVLFLPLVIIGVMLPHVTEYFSKVNFDKAERMIHFSLKNSVIFLMPLIITLTFFSRQAITYLYNIGYVDARFFMFPYLLASALLGINLILMTALYAGGYPGKRLKYMWLSVIVNLIASVSLFNVFGSIGIAYGLLISQATLFMLLVLRTKMKLNITFPKKIFNSLPPIFLFYAMLYAIDKYYFGFKYAMVFLIISGFVYLGLLHLFRAIDELDYRVLKMTFGK